MKIVVLDGYTENPGDLSWEGLERFGKLTVYDRTPFDESIIVERIGDADIVITNKTPISVTTINRCKSIRYIGVLATGYNVVDVAAAKEHGIPVTNIPAYGTTSVAQMVFALLLEICHHVGAHSEAVHNGDWSACPDFCFWNYPLIELAGKTIGIIGFGRIGVNTAKIAQAFGMRVLACDEHQNEEARRFGTYVDLDTLLAESDVISLHCPLFPSTAEIIRNETINKMKDGVILINTSRGPLVNETDLYNALESGKISYAGLDVVSSEPISSDNILLRAKNCLITPHISWAPKEARMRLMDIAAGNVQAFVNGDPVNVVNR